MQAAPWHLPALDNLEQHAVLEKLQDAQGWREIVGPFENAYLLSHCKALQAVGWIPKCPNRSSTTPQESKVLSHIALPRQ